jgi:hypothetical protein
MPDDSSQFHQDFYDLPISTSAVLDIFVQELFRRFLDQEGGEQSDHTLYKCKTIMLIELYDIVLLNL